MVRLCFVLGNLTAKNEQARQRLFQEKDALDVLLNVLRTYNDMDKQVRLMTTLQFAAALSEVC